MPHQKQKILHLIQSLQNGGCENMLLRTLPLLDGFEHKIIALKELGELTPKFVSAGITVETIHCSGLFDIPGIFRLRKLVREEKPDIILTYLFHADIIGRTALHSITKAPIIPFLRTTYNHPKYLIARILEWLTKPPVRHYLANSEAVKDFYVNNIGVRPEKITIIPNGIDTEYFDSIIPDPELKKSLNIAPDDFIIICVANLHINKGHRYLLEAFEQLSTSPSPCHSRESGNPALLPEGSSRVREGEGWEKKRNLRLLLIGDGIEKENLQSQIENYQSKKNILFLGKRSDVPQLLKISNLFVLPTLFEGMSNALMEAMASALPIITTDIPENRILIENEKTGLLVPVENSSAIVQAIEKLLSDENKRKTLRENTKSKLHEYYDIKIVASKLAHFFDSL